MSIVQLNDPDGLHSEVMGMVPHILAKLSIPVEDCMGDHDCSVRLRVVCVEES